jgi:hypothetical protein
LFLECSNFSLDRTGLISTHTHLHGIRQRTFPVLIILLEVISNL